MAILAQAIWRLVALPGGVAVAGLPPAPPPLFGERILVPAGSHKSCCRIGLAAPCCYTLARSAPVAARSSFWLLMPSSGEGVSSSLRGKDDPDTHDVTKLGAMVQQFSLQVGALVDSVTPILPALTAVPVCIEQQSCKLTAWAKCKSIFLCATRSWMPILMASLPCSFQRCCMRQPLRFRRYLKVAARCRVVDIELMVLRQYGLAQNHQAVLCMRRMSMILSLLSFVHFIGLQGTNFSRPLKFCVQTIFDVGPSCRPLTNTGKMSGFLGCENARCQMKRLIHLFNGTRKRETSMSSSTKSGIMYL